MKRMHHTTIYFEQSAKSLHEEFYKAFQRLVVLGCQGTKVRLTQARRSQDSATYVSILRSQLGRDFCLLKKKTSERQKYTTEVHVSKTICFVPLDPRRRLCLYLYQEQKTLHKAQQKKNLTTYVRTFTA